MCGRSVGESLKRGGMDQKNKFLFDSFRRRSLLCKNEVNGRERVLGRDGRTSVFLETLPCRRGVYDDDIALLAIGPMRYVRLVVYNSGRKFGLAVIESGGYLTIVSEIRFL